MPVCSDCRVIAFLTGLGEQSEFSIIARNAFNQQIFVALGDRASFGVTTSSPSLGATIKFVRGIGIVVYHRKVIWCR